MSAVKEARQVLRQVQEHLFHAHHSLGAQHETRGLVDVVHHPTLSLPDLNYVTPRRNTAWVPGDEIQNGLDHLRGLARKARVQYIEGLFPPLFAKTLHQLNLTVERETPIMVYKVDGLAGVIPPPLTTPETPDGVNVMPVTDQRGLEMWWYVWRNAHYDVLSLGVEPLYIGRDTASLVSGQHIDFIALRYGFPMGVVRASIQPNTAHITALALMKEVRSPEMMRLLQVTAAKAALEHGCTIIFGPGETDADRRLIRSLGFIDTGSMVSYSAENAIEETNALEQSVLAPK